MVEEEGRQRRGFRVSGRVQGVGFRWWTRDTGQALGLGGHVRNLPDGSVEVHASGPGASLDDLERRLHRGPPGARVESVERIAADPRTPEEGFFMERWA